MFTQECFIRKNTKELQQKLKNLGYSICKCYNYDNAVWLKTYISNKEGRYEVHGVGYDSDEINLMGYDTIEKRLNFFLDENEKCENKCIDCGTNEELFLAIAALRDNNDYMQWFVCNEDYITYAMKDHKKGEFVLFQDKKASINKCS